MSTSANKTKRISAYQIFGWTPLMITMVGATTVVVLSVLGQK